MTINEAIEQLLTKKDKAERVAAASTLGEFDHAHDHVIPALVKALQDVDRDVRLASVNALMSIWRTLHAPPDYSLLSILAESDPEPDPNPEPDRFFEPVIPALQSLLVDDDKYLRVAAAEALRNLYCADGAVLDVLIKSARDVDEGLRRRAAYAFWQGASELKLVSTLAAPFLGGGRAPLHDVDSEPVIAVLVELVQDPSRDVREYAVSAISSIGPAAGAAIPVLAQALQDPDEVVRFKAAGALASVGVASSPALAGLVQGLTDPDRLTRKAAAFALRALGPEAKPAIPHLIKGLQDEEPRVRARCAEALGNIGSDVGGDAIHGLLALERDDERIVRDAAARALAAVGKEAVDAAHHRLAGLRSRDAYPHLGFKADDIPGLIFMLRDANPDIRAFGATALRLAPGDARAAIPVLIELLKDGDEDVRRRATETLKAMRDG